MSRETGWVIEHNNSPVHSPQYFAGVEWHDQEGISLKWSGNHLEAIRFKREEDAKNCLLVVGHRICEHGWG